MILQSLAQYYNRLVADPGIKIPSYGFTEQKVYFCLVLDPDGSLVQVEDLRQGGGKKPRPLMMDAPFLPGRTSGIKTFFLCDNTGYVLGWDGKGKTLDKFQAFKDLHHELLGDTDDEDLKTLLRFIDSWVPERCAKLKYWEDMAGYNVVFRLDGQLRYLHQYPEAIEKWQKYSWDMLTKTQGMCLVSGEDGIISQLHWPIKGVRKAQPTGATIVSFNAKAYESYSKDQCYNAPVREDCAFAYVTALNRLLAFEGRQKIQLGDSTTVFWTEKPSPAEELLPQLLAAESMDDKSRAHDTGVMLKLRGILEALRDGKYPPDLGDPSVKFFILGLSPNNSRLAVRLWSVSSVGELAERAGQHFEDFALE
ncbi:MAG: type I-C CRISPR-associated protein Cas8c/Csd1, partial [Chloroflexi bacterium]|nr:type I-C CRISPR-associated protein Cas8c/Csd1 [Chloroflexota bacterium]